MLAEKYVLYAVFETDTLPANGSLALQRQLYPLLRIVDDIVIASLWH